MSQLSSMPPEAISNAMVEGVRSHIRAALRDEFQKVADLVIEEAIKQAMATFEVSVQAFREPYNMRDVVEVILRDSRKKEKPNA